eukprot:TRINITY_DN11106_c0_g1_i1.p1 TRINITY_DN11106_c0_g1~~TRINITY_DN11106_c0_g1_i1.p1  ORF type:complete len:559 (+),score=75.64 TRINITY_DN11106_c0_g1_i1:28-1704(+)
MALISNGSRIFESVCVSRDFNIRLRFVRSLHMTRCLHELAPPKPVISMPLPVERKALKRHKNLSKLAKDQDKARLKTKPVIISTKRKELEHRMGQTYGVRDNVPLVSDGWKHRKSIGDYFTINKFKPIRANNFESIKENQPRFSQLDIHPELVSALKSCGYNKLTNIQSECLPSLVDNKDSHSLIAAETGNGKTLCFLVPILNNIIKLKQNESTDIASRPSRTPLAVIAAPSRELATQIAAVARDIGQQVDVRVDQVTAASQIMSDTTANYIGHTDLIVGSFGSLVKLFNSRYLKKTHVAEIALDEIDTLLDDTFKSSLVPFLKKFGQSKYTLLEGVRILMTGATFPTNFDNYMSEVIDLEGVGKFSTDQIHKVLAHLQQKFIRVAATKKLETLVPLLEKDSAKKKKTLIFCNKASTSDFLHYYLGENNFTSINFNQNVHPKDRFSHYSRFITGDVNIMTATDLASRGLDTSTVHHVINYDFPLNAADYLHRAGRVGRVGSCSGGHVTSLVDNPLGVEVLQRIEYAARKNVEILNVNNNIIRIIQHRHNQKINEDPFS